MKFLRRKSGEFQTIGQEFLSVEGIDPRLWVLLTGLDGLLQARYSKELLITCLSRTVPEERKLHGTGMPFDSVNSGHLVRPCAAADFVLVVSSPGKNRMKAGHFDIDDARWVTGMFMQYLRGGRGDLARISDVPYTHIHLQVSHTLKEEDMGEE